MSDPTSPSASVNLESAPVGRPDDRATTFQPIPGPQAEHYSGEVLLVSAYAVLFVILVSWVALAWRKAGGMDKRLTALEGEIDKAAAADQDRKPAARDPHDAK
jgi:hypothetical protein